MFHLALCSLALTVASSGTELLPPLPTLKCEKFTRRVPPRSVADLQLRDIRVVAGMGDSITAGFAINNLPEESRDKSYCCGDGKGELTINNFLNDLNSENGGVIGGEKFNKAVSGAVVQGVSEQADRLIEALEQDRSVSMKEDWKLLTIWIGANNECPSCHGSKADSTAVYGAELEATLKKLQTKVPRLFVNLVATLNLTSLADAPGVAENCKLQHAVLTRVECPCAFESKAEGVKMDNLVQANDDMLLKLEAKFNGTSDDFAAVVQPGLRHMLIPDHTYLSHFDCFHPSLLCHQQIAQGLFNNMQTPVGSKSTDFSTPVKFNCPDPESPLFS